MPFTDVIFLVFVLFVWWLATRDKSLAYKLPMGAKYKDPHNMGGSRTGKAEGILYLGNIDKTNEEVWFTNSDARTHILYLGTTGAGKTEGLKSMVSNALTWASGFVYIDGKADTDLWSSLSSLVRRFGRDDDLLVLNYMTGNSDTKAPSNTMNPFSSGSASYLTNMLVSLMPDAEGDNAMWKERAVSLVASLMPVLTWKRDNQEIPMSVSTIRHYLTLNNIIKLSRDKVIPEHLRYGVKGYLDTLPGYIDAAFDDDGKEKPAGPDQPMYDTTTPRQQHGYLSMQFTRSLQSLGDEYGYIFDSQAADVDMVDVVLNRRILVVLIPALEKSGDETANLGKIVAATLKGMMGSTLGSTVEGESATVIENKVTASSTPFMVVFDEVGYYAAQGMAVMAAQARSLGFCLIYSAQDLPAMEKRVKEEARSITANCNIKIFGKLEDPTQTKEFFEKTVGSSLVMEASGFQLSGGRGTGSYHDNMQASLQIRPRASYDGLRGFKEGKAVIAFGEMVADALIFHSNPGFAKAMRVTRYVSLPPPDENVLRNAPIITRVRDLMVHKTWTALKADAPADIPEELRVIADTFARGEKKRMERDETGMAAVASVYILHNPAELHEKEETTAASSGGSGSIAPAAPRPGGIPGMPPRKDPPLSSTPAQAAPPASSSPPAAATGNPMAFFGPKKTEEPPASVTTPMETAAPATENPMAFFGSKKPAETAAPPATQVTASAPPPAAGGPVNWADLVSLEENKPAVAAPAEPAPRETTPAPAVTALSQETQDILKKAGEDLRNKIFKDSDQG